MNAGEPPGFAADADDHWLAGVEATYDAATDREQPISPPAMLGVTETSGLAADANAHWLDEVEATYEAASGREQPTSPPAMLGVTETPGLRANADDHWLGGVEAAYDAATGHARSAQPHIVAIRPSAVDAEPVAAEKRADLKDWVQGEEETSTAREGSSPPSSTDTLARAISRFSQLNADLDRITAAFARSGGSLRQAELRGGAAAAPS